MKIIHLSDLHLGKRLNEYSLLEDQRDILAKIVNIIDNEKPQAVIIAGDVYDKPDPSAEAVSLFDDFLSKLAKRRVDVMIISGNHDSPERLAFGSAIMETGGIHLSPVYSGEVKPVVLSDEYGTVSFYMLPFVKPAHVRRFFPDAKIDNYTDAIRTAIDAMGMNCSERNVLITHQFITGAGRSDSEDISVGGTDNVSGEVFEGIDYVALGHIHGPQNVCGNAVRYCGTPLKYSFSEKNHEKSVTVAELGEKGSLEVRTVPLVPKRDMRELRGTYSDLVLKSNYEGTAVDDYLRIVLTDEEDIPDVISKLRSIYPNIMELVYDNSRTRSSAAVTAAEEIEKKSDIQLFKELFELQNGKPMSEEQFEFCMELFGQVREGTA